MTKQPWLKFYPADWRADPKLRMCSLAARGLWMDMLALMHEAEPYGYLLVNGRAPDSKQLAALVGARPGELQFLLNELEGAGVFSRDEEGRIYSRRMVRDHARSEEGRRWVEKRYATKGNGHEPTSPPTRSPTDEPTTQKPEARSQKPESEKRERAPRGTRLPADWVLSEDWKSGAAANRAKHGLPSLNLDLEAEKFRNHWHGQSGARGIKLDWRATWMKWALSANAPRDGPGTAALLTGAQILANAKW